MEYTGKIKFIWDIETVGKGIDKRVFVLEEITDKKWKGWIAIDLMKDNVKLIDKFNVWDTVRAHLNFQCNFYEKTQRYYNWVKAWRIDLVDWFIENDDDDSDYLPF